MATETEERLLRIKIDNTQAVEEISNLKNLIDRLTDSNKKLTAQNKELTRQLSELAKSGKQYGNEFSSLNALLEKNKTQILANSAAVKKYSKDIDENSKQITQNIANQRETEGSLKNLRAHLDSLISQYDRLSKAERENAQGQELRKKINETNESLKREEEAIGITKRNIGNYEGALHNVINAQKEADSGFIATVKNLKNMSESAGGLGKLLKGSFTTAIKGIGSTLNTILKTPMIAIIAGVAMAIMGLVKAFKANDEQLQKLQVLFAPFRSFLDWLSGILSKIVDGLINMIAGLSNGIGYIATWLEKFPLIGDKVKEINDSAKEAIQLEKDKQALNEANVANITAQAETEKKVFQLRNEAMRNNKLNAEERLALIDEAGRLELAQAEKNRNLKEEELRLLQAEVEKKGMSAEQEREIQELTAEIIRMQIEEGQKANELADQRLSFQKSLADEQKKADEERRKRQEEYQKLVESGNEQLRKLTLDLMAEGAEKEKAIREEQYRKDLASAQGTEEQKAQIREKLTELYYRDLATIDEKYRQEELDKAVATRTMELNAELELARENVDKQLAIKLELLAQEKAAAIKNAEETGASVETIEALYVQRAADLETEAEQQRAEARNEKMAQMLEQTAEQYARQLEMYAENEQAMADTQLEIETAKLKALQDLDAEQKAQMFDSEEAYQEALREQIKATDEAQKRSAEESKKARLAAIEDAQSKMDSIGNIAGSIGELFTQIAGDNETMQKFLKGVALFQIGIDMAKAIAGAIAGAMTQPFPANIAAVVSGIAAVVSGIVQAKQTLSQQKEEPAPKFAEGGLVTGPGTGTSDSVPAMLSNGESVMTAAATAMFAPMLSAMNVAGGGVPISVSPVTIGLEIDDMMTQSVVKAFASLPAPVVSVEEINTVENRVKVAEINMYH